MPISSTPVTGQAPDVVRAERSVQGRELSKIRADKIDVQQQKIGISKQQRQLQQAEIEIQAQELVLSKKASDLEKISQSLQRAANEVRIQQARNGGGAEITQRIARGSQGFQFSADPTEQANRIGTIINSQA